MLDYAFLLAGYFVYQTGGDPMSLFSYASYTSVMIYIISSDKYNNTVPNILILFYSDRYTSSIGYRPCNYVKPS
jgi:hypothetical protein